MSAKRAANALFSLDLEIAEKWKDSHDHVLNHDEATELVIYLRGLWTVTLAAESAGVSEGQVIAAVLHNHFRVGTLMVCQGYAERGQ